jgi:hypothetical protein
MSRIVEVRVPRSVALVAPAVRVVIVHAFAWNEGDELRTAHVVYPVVAIRSSVVDRYDRPREEGEHPPRALPDREAMLAAGWSYRGRDVEEDLLIITSDFDLCPASLALGACNAESRPVACPWPAEEDAERLADVIDDLKAGAIEKERRNLGRAPAAEPEPAGAPT